MLDKKKRKEQHIGCFAGMIIKSLISNSWFGDATLNINQRRKT